MTLRRLSPLGLCLGLLVQFTLMARADVRLPGLFSDHMVLQQNVRVRVWGWSDDGEEVTVNFRGQTARAKAKDGKWAVTLNNLRPGAPDTLTISGKNRIELKNVLVGDVWVCSGQSNMHWLMNRTDNADIAIANSANSNLRLFAVPLVKSDEPLDDVKASWQQCKPQTVSNFSAVAYYFGRELERARGVPIGLIHTSWGGSPAEVWMSHRTLSASPEYQRDILDAYPDALKRYQRARAEHEKQKAQNNAAGKTAPRTPWKPTELYNAMIAPLLPFAIKGAIWYQGESNAGRAEQYHRLMPDLIRNWRRDWGQDLPFFIVQLAPFKAIQPQPGESDWAELREAQLLTTKKLPKVGLAVITDGGDENDIHPRNKKLVGERLALAARGVAYGEKIVYSGPLLKSMKVRGDKAILSFDHVGGGLEARGGELKGFAICGPDKKFLWADADIQGDKVVVRSPEVSRPVAVRYGWADYPTGNLWNKDGLPATPFRTDDFPMITRVRK